MYICPICNAEVPDPVDRKCRNGHGLFDGRIAGTTQELSFVAAFVWALVIGLALTALTGALKYVLPASTFGAVSAGLLVAFIIVGVTAILRGFKWLRQGGPVRRLASRAFGTGIGCLCCGVVPFILELTLWR